MSGDWKSRIARRPLLASLAGVLGVAAVGGLAYETSSLFRRPYRPTPYDDLLTQLPDRDSAAKLGTAVLKHGFDAKSAADALRHKLGHASLAQVVERDIARGELVEIHGWLLPVTLTTLAALAAQAQ